MKFAAGYQARQTGELFSELIADYAENIEEVYFSYPGFASGRPENAVSDDLTEQVEYELGVIKSMNIKLDLLLNGNCYGSDAISVKFQQETVSLLKYLDARGLLPEIVTTTSPFVASVIRQTMPEMEIRASVNMRIDSLTALEYLLEKFDSFYLRRDLQRDLATLKLFSDWSQAHGKKMCLLANSGCLRNCPYQTFHDNLVAHDRQLRKKENVKDFIPHLCWERYYSSKKLEDFIRSSWLRPEDIKYYEPYCQVIKLATRQHSNIRMVLAAYCSGRFDGNMLDLTEPCFSQVFAPQILDNRLLDDVELPGSCAINCSDCGKCSKIVQKATRSLFA